MIPNDTDKHIVLVGDSVFDNGAYTDGGPDVATQLQALSGHRVTLLAQDGGITHDVIRQLRRLPSDATHLFLSVGGNDALGHEAVLMAPTSNVGEALMELMDAVEVFEQDYRRALAAVLSPGLPTIACTIYNGAFPEPEGRIIRGAVRLFNDSIFQAAFDAGVPVIDLRRVCTESGDYWNPIEPNAVGGEKIAHAILAVLDEGDGEGRSWVYPSGVSTPPPSGAPSA